MPAPHPTDDWLVRLPNETIIAASIPENRRSYLLVWRALALKATQPPCLPSP